MPWTLNRDLNAACVDKLSGEVLWADDPEDGYDFSFTIDDKSKQWRQYVGAQVSRKSSPLSNDEREQEDWLQQAVDNPVTEQTIFRSYDELAEIFSGASPSTEEDEDLDDDDDETATDGGRILDNMDDDNEDDEEEEFDDPEESLDDDPDEDDEEEEEEAEEQRRPARTSRRSPRGERGEERPARRSSRRPARRTRTTSRD